MPSTNCNIENEYWKIVHVPDEPPIPPHLQPTVNAHASVINPKHANTLIRKLNKISPLEDLRHVKRIRKRCVEGIQVPSYIKSRVGRTVQAVAYFISSTNLIVNAAVIVNPTSNQVVARSCDQVFSQKNTSTRKNIGAGYLEPCETTSSPSIISGLQTHTSSTSNSSFNKQKRPYSDVSCLHPWQWTEQQSQASCFRHPLHHAAMVAIENYASRDRYLFPASKDVGDKWCQADFGDSPLTIVPTKRQTTNTYVEDSGIENGETARPYLCTGYDIYLVWEPCIMCAMALVHQRIKRIFYAFPNPYAGALESLHRLQGEKSLNHHYAVFRVFLPESILDRGDIIATTSRINQNKIQV
ncbi:tRNA-specific adenosine deaminase TAD3-like isoform X2 [Apium graveolens]|uniref:tRNA-specific adenosine deaminase TAD3-like isoform X2 n=1 Tax=Apium graveolens TaxID=4045 RepID=UPI003D7A4FCD